MDIHISIIIPVYNTPLRELERCFNSVSLPDEINYEVIIIDDGSEDCVGDFCKTYIKAKNQFKYLYQSNRGVSAARNTGITHAQGKYIMFLDADDELVGGVYRRDILDAECDVVFFDMEVCHDNQRKFHKQFDMDDGRFLSKYEVITVACQNRLNSSWAKLFRKEMIVNNGIAFSTDMVVAEDACFTFRVIAVAEKMFYTSVIGYRYYHSYSNGNSRVAQFPSKVTENVVQLYNNRKEALKEHGELWGFNDEAREAVCASIEENMIKALFETKGTLLVMGVTCREIDPQIMCLAAAVDIKHFRKFSPITRLKCVLLKYELSLLITLYAYLRGIYLKFRN